MDSFRGTLFMLMMLAVKASEDSDFGLERATDVFLGSDLFLQRPLDIPAEILDTVKQATLVSEPNVRKKGPPFLVEQSILFPLARPTMDNILAICHNGNRRPRYTKDMLPRTGFGYLHRKAQAINLLETWFTVCCSNGTQNEELTLCCAQQAWEKSLSAFCKEEFSIKTSHYHCCNKDEPERWDCFAENAPDPVYQPSEQETMLSTTIESDFSSCQKSSPEIMTDISSKKERIRILPTTQFFNEDEASSHPTWPSIVFPPARPTITNVLAICQYSNQRLQHPKVPLPRFGFNHLHLRARAVNQLESLYTLCCKNDTQDDKLTLCCAQKAWEKTLSAFCIEEHGIKTIFPNHHYHCCEENGPKKWDCFERAAFDTSYQPVDHKVPIAFPYNIQDLVFDFDQNSCQEPSISSAALRAITETPHINFPPGRPNSDNIGHICTFRRNRPRYLTDCLPPTGFDWFGHQLKAINHLENSFGQCCKENKDIQACADGKWKKMVDRFCKDDKKIRANHFECCEKPKGKEQYDCFSTAAPNPSYMPIIDYIHSGETLSPDTFCDTYTALQKMKRLPFPVDEMAEECCSLMKNKLIFAHCVNTQLDKLSDDACKADDPRLAQVKQSCCKLPAMRLSRCFTKQLMNYIAIAKRPNNNRKQCPFLS